MFLLVCLFADWSVIQKFRSNIIFIYSQNMLHKLLCPSFDGFSYRFLIRFLLHNLILDIRFDKFILNIFSKHVLIKVCMFLFPKVHVFDVYNIIRFILVLNIVIFVRVESLFDLKVMFGKLKGIMCFIYPYIYFFFHVSSFSKILPK